MLIFSLFFSPISLTFVVCIKLIFIITCKKKIIRIFGRLFNGLLRKIDEYLWFFPTNALNPLSWNQYFLPAPPFLCIYHQVTNCPVFIINNKPFYMTYFTIGSLNIMSSYCITFNLKVKERGTYMSNLSNSNLTLTFISVSPIRFIVSWKCIG